MTHGRRDAALASLVAAWIGATILFGAVVAPAAFAVLPTRSLAGALVGRVLPVLFLSGLVTGALIIVSGRWTRSTRRARARIALGLLMVLSCGAAQFVIGPRIERTRAEAGASLDALPAGHPVRVTFGRLHGLSVVGLGVATVAALATLVLAGTRPTALDGLAGRE